MEEENAEPPSDVDSCDGGASEDEALADMPQPLAQCASQVSPAPHEEYLSVDELVGKRLPSPDQSRAHDKTPPAQTTKTRVHQQQTCCLHFKRTVSTRAFDANCVHHVPTAARQAHA